MSYLLTSRAKLLSLEFAFWLIGYQFLFISLLGIGLIQSHIGCPMPLEECYVEGYRGRRFGCWSRVEASAASEGLIILPNHLDLL